LFDRRSILAIERRLRLKRTLLARYGQDARNKGNEVGINSLMEGDCRGHAGAGKLSVLLQGSERIGALFEDSARADSGVGGPADALCSKNSRRYGSNRAAR